MIQPKSPKVEKLQNTPSEPSCQPENGLLTFHSRTCKIVSECEPAQRPNHFTFERARMWPTAEQLGAKNTSRSKAQGWASERWFARSPKHFTFECAAIHVWMSISLEPKLLHLWICWWTSEITSECESTQESTHFAFECAKLSLNAILPRSHITLHSNALGFMFGLHLHADLLRGQTYLTTQCVVSSTATLSD